MKRIFILILAVISILCCLVSCDDPSAEKCVIWTDLNDENTISDGETVYKKYAELPINFDVGGIRYRNSATSNGYTHTSALDSGIKYLKIRGELVAYVAEGTDTSALDGLIAGVPESIKLYKGYDAADIDADLVAKLDALSENAIEIPVRELRESDYYDIVYLCDSDALSYVHGRVFVHKDELYYVNFDKLTNNYFDSYGDFSFFRGTVELYPIGQTIEDGIMTKMETAVSYDRTDFVLEADLYNEMDNSESAARATIAVTLTVFGIIAPLVPLTVGILHLVLKKKKKLSFAYSFIIPSSVWLICGIILLIISL